MGKAKAFLISIVVAALAVAGAAFAMRGMSLGLSAPEPAGIAPAALSASQSRLDRWSAELRKQRAAQPPALPALPRFARVTIPKLAPSPVFVENTRQTDPGTAAAPTRFAKPKTALPAADDASANDVEADDTLAASPPASPAAGRSGHAGDDGRASDDARHTDGHDRGGQPGDESSDDGSTGSDD